MAMLDMREQMRLDRFDLGLMQRVGCTNDENKRYKALLKAGQPLPEGVYQSGASQGQPMGYFYTISQPNLTEDEVAEILLFKQIKYLKNIRDCLFFFAGLVAVSIIVALIMSIAILV